MADEETSSSSEEEEPFVDETDDKYFFKALSCLKNKDPKIYDPKVVFFPEEDKEGEVNEANESKIKKSKGEKALYLRDYERDLVVKAMKEEDGGSGDNEIEDTKDDDDLPYAVQQKSLKASFKAVLEDSESEDDGLLTMKEKTAQDKEKEDEEYKAWLKGNKEELSDKETEQDLKPLQNYWSKPDLDPNEQFLRDYILNRRYLEEGEEAEDDGISEDGELLEMQEKFETDYNLRFENENNTEVKRYPRVIDGSLRRTDDRRKQKRKERNERKKLEKEKKKDDIAKNQKQKLLEFKEQVEKIKKLTGNDQLGFKDEEIFGDDEFDPEEHDRKMQELYSDAFYSAEGGDDQKPDFANEEDVGGWEDDEDMDVGDPDNMDLEAAGSSGKTTKKESRSKKKRKEKKKKAFTDIIDIAKPVFDPNVHNSYQKYIDEYYEMDCEDFIDDIPCKFKYRQTVPNDYGLTVEEILAADDKELNQWVSAKKITKLRPDHVEKNEVKIYKQKAQDFGLKKKVLASIYGSPKREEEEEDAKQEEQDTAKNTDEESAITKKSKKKRKHSFIEKGENGEAESNDAGQNGHLPAENQNVPKKKKKNQLNDGSVQNQTPNNKHKQNPNKIQNQPNGLSKKKKFGKGGKNRQKGDGKKNSDPIPTVSDTRLMAYDINPQKLKKKLKYKK
uniref:Protein KRI1 homolog n=1 Tax=Lygus hesperus TaxID=30085 RepID=A0A0A9ZC13_LYGHE